MDTEEGKVEAKTYGVEIKGFPTLYTFVVVLFCIKSMVITHSAMSQIPQALGERK